MKIKFLQAIIDKIRGKNKQKAEYFENGRVKFICAPKKTSTDKKIELKQKFLKKFEKKYIPPKNTYKKLVCVCGFGDSGSGAVFDMLSELNNTTVIGDHDIHGGSSLSVDKSVYNIELQILTCYSGVFDLESAFEPISTSSNIKILAFLQAMEYFYKTPIYNICNDKFMDLVYEFIDNITEGKIESRNPLAGNNAFIFKKGEDEKEYSNIHNPFVFDKLRKRFYWVPKDITRKQYRAYAKEFICKFLNTIDSKEIMVLDQFLACYGADFDKFREYLGDYKMITVYRDPRDVYSQAVLVKHLWVAQNPDEFILWYKSKHIEKYINSKNPNSLCLRFEDIVLDYDNKLNSILKFLNIDKSHHVDKKIQFNPEFSIRNIGLYKAFEDQKAIERIENSLSEFCYCGK